MEPLQGVYRGGEIKTVSSEFWSTFETVELETHGFRQVGSHVVVPNTAHLRGRDGIEVIARSTFVYTVENGQITRLRMFQEQSEALEAGRAVGVGDVGGERGDCAEALWCPGRRRPGWRPC